jgi:hypothetical protein
METRVSVGAGGGAGVAADVEGWREAGATHVSVNTMGAGFLGVEAHLDALAAAAAALRLTEQAAQ